MELKGNQVGYQDPYNNFRNLSGKEARNRRSAIRQYKSGYADPGN